MNNTQVINNSTKLRTKFKPSGLEKVEPL